MRTIHDWFDEYGESHRHPTNKLVHWVCVPVIFFSVIGLLRSIPVVLLEEPFRLDVAGVLEAPVPKAPPVAPPKPVVAKAEPPPSSSEEEPVAPYELDVEVKLVDELSAGATVVPVSALVARGDGTFEVEALTTTGTTFVPVDPGMFSDGVVAVEGIAPGTQVVVP